MGQSQRKTLKNAGLVSVLVETFKCSAQNSGGMGVYLFPKSIGEDSQNFVCHLLRLLLVPGFGRIIGSHGVNKVFYISLFFILPKFSGFFH